MPIRIIRHNAPEELIEQIRHCSCVVTVEDHSIHGGLGAYAAELAAQHHPVFMDRIGLKDCFGESGEAGALADKFGLSAENIARVCKMLFAKTQSK